MVERLGEMRKWRRERIKKGSREIENKRKQRKDKETKGSLLGDMRHEFPTRFCSKALQQ